MRLLTSRWSNRDLAELECAPVGISRGVPRFRTGYEYRVLRSLAPSREAFAIEDPEEFAEVYRAGLEEIGFDAIMAKLAKIGRENGGLPLVLLCYEPEDGFCHRHVLRDWLAERGVEIKELEPGDLPQRQDAPEPRLFDDHREERG